MLDISVVKSCFVAIFLMEETFLWSRDLGEEEEGSESSLLEKPPKPGQTPLLPAAGPKVNAAGGARRRSQTLPLVTRANCLNGEFLCGCDPPCVIYPTCTLLFTLAGRTHCVQPHAGRRGLTP